MVNNILIREYRNEDKNQVLDLLNRNFEKQQHLSIIRDNEWWEWKYEKNIFGKPIIYVAESSKNIIAVRPLWPWRLNIRGKELSCFQPLDSVVDEGFRGKGLFSEITRKVINENIADIDIIFNFPNKQSIDAYLKLGWSLVGKLQWYIKINRPFGTFNLHKHYSGFKSLKLEADDSITFDKVGNLEECISFDGKLKTKRNNAFLAWRYLDHPKINYGMSVIKKKRRHLVYVYEINENDHGRELIIVDYFGDLLLFNKMLQELNCISNKYQTAYTLILKKYNTPTNILIRNCYLKQSNKNFVVLPLNIALNNIATKYDNWDIFLGMHDSI